MLEGRHVIGLFFLMLLFSGVFFTLGYVMGRKEFEGQVRAEGEHALGQVDVPGLEARRERQDRLLYVSAEVDDLPIHLIYINKIVNFWLS